MPIQSGVGDMSIGKDVAVDIVQADGSILRLGNITSFDRKPVTKQINSDGIDGVPRKGVIPGGWKLSFDIDREGPSADDWWALYEDNYYANRPLQNVMITETISEPDGTVTQWRYVGVALHFSDAGNWKADAVTKMKLEGEASYRKKVA